MYPAAKVFADDISLHTVDTPALVYRTFRIDDCGGIVNRKLDRGETADLILGLRNAGGAVGATMGTLISRGSFIEILDDAGSFGPVGAGETTASNADWFRVRVAGDAPVEVPLYCELILNGSGYNDTLTIPLIVGDSMNLPVGPDGYGYRIYDWTDSCYTSLPVYDWVELRGRGERLTLGDDETRCLELPVEFGHWRYYGNEYRYLSVCANGWIAADTTSRCDFTNVELPYSGAPPNIVAFLWDDLAPSRYGSIWFYYDTANHRFVVEFDSISYFGMAECWEKVQVHVYDTAIAGPNRDNPIAIHFQTINDFRLVTVGMQNHNGSAGLTYLWDGRYPRTAAPLVSQRSLWIEGEVPSGEKEVLTRVKMGGSVQVVPNPFRNTVRVIVPSGLEAEATVYRADGRLVKRLWSAQFPGAVFVWDGRDENNRKVAPGLYFVRMEKGGEGFKKIVLIP